MTNQTYYRNLQFQDPKIVEGVFYQQEVKR